MKLWIRSHNGDVRDIPTATADEAWEAFEAYEWKADLEDYDPAKDSATHCLPALGLVHGDNASCDISPFNETDCRVNLSFYEPRKLFGLIDMPKNIHRHLSNFPQARVRELIDLFSRHDIEELKSFS